MSCIAWSYAGDAIADDQNEYYCVRYYRFVTGAGQNPLRFARHYNSQAEFDGAAPLGDGSGSITLEP